MIVNRFQIESKIGSGVMGAVYKGYDTLTQQTIAIRQLRPELIQRDFLERVKYEGEVLRSLDHPNIVKLLDTVAEDNNHYLILEYVSGGSLNALIRSKQLSIGRILKLAIELADALTCAHELQIIHRDLKPANVLVTHDGALRITDFGIARASMKKEFAETSSILVDYLSPEMLNDESRDGRIDIWAFGVMLFEMLTAEHPFRTEDMAATRSKILTWPLPDLETLRPDIPISLIDLVYRMLERDLQMRIASARQVRAELEDISRDLQVPNNLHKRFVTPIAEKLVRPKQNLPLQITPFVGRERELEELTALLSNPQNRLITVLAPGGMGKTRLSLEVAQRQIGVFSSGVFFVDLTPLSDVANIPFAVADILGYQLQVDGREPKRQILGYLENKHMLLVIDNWEHLIEGAALVSDILQAAADVKVIATSRERLNLQEETLFHIEGMDFPELNSPSDDLEQSAVQLFVQSAKRAQPAFKLKANDMKYITRICRSVSGMPLGILLAAAWLGTLSLTEIADEIGKSLDFLETEARNTPVRQRSIRAVFDSSWNLMTDTERDVLMKLSVFRSGFTREAAQHVAGATLRQLASLVNKSLIWRDADKGRYRIHELLRQYTYEHLEAQSGDTTPISDTHSDYYMNFVAAHVDIHGGSQVQAVIDLESELENIRNAWQWAIDHGNVEAIQRSAHTLMMFYQYKSRYLDGTDAFEKAAQNLDRLEATEKQRFALAIVLVDLGWFWLRLGQIENAKSALERSHMLLESLDTPPLAIAATEPLAALSIVTVVQGNYALAIQIGEQAFRVCQARGDKGNMISCSLALASALMAQGDYQATQKVAQQGSAFAQELGHGWLNAYCLNLLGSATQALHDYSAARQHYQASYTIREAFNDAEGMAVALNHLGKLAWVQEDYSEAKGLYQRSLSLYQNLGDNGGLVNALLGLGLADCKLEDDRSARQHFYGALHTALEVRLMPLAMTVITSVVELFPDSWSSELAIELLVLVLDHSASNYETRDKAQQLLAGYPLTSSRIAKIKQHMNFDAVTSALLKELRKPVDTSTLARDSRDDNWQRLDPLTEREQEVLRHIANGFSNRAIASKLFISIGTVKWYCSQIYDKLGVQSRTQAILRAQESNLLS